VSEEETIVFSLFADFFSLGGVKYAKMAVGIIELTS
jgi:hypothetical protein